MGSISKMMKDITGAGKDEQEQKERLQVILMAAKAKIASFKTEIDEMFTNPAIIEKKQIPGIRALRYIEQYHVASREGFSQQVGDHMTAAIDAFFSIGDNKSGDKNAVKTGLKELISTALDAFVGSTEVGESEKRIYVVVPENNAFVRVDLACWKYHFAQHKLIDQKDTAVAYILCKSVVDHNKLALDELIYLVSEAMQTSVPLPGNFDPGTLQRFSENSVLEAILRAVRDKLDSTQTDAVKSALNSILDQKHYKAAIGKIQSLSADLKIDSNIGLKVSINTTLKEKLKVGIIDDNAPDGVSFDEKISFDMEGKNDADPVKYIEKMINNQTNRSDETSAGVIDLYRKSGPNGEIILLTAASSVISKHMLDVSGMQKMRRPPSITEVSEYIDELIRVWNKLTKERAPTGAPQ